MSDADGYRQLIVGGDVMRVGRSLLTLLVTLLIATQVSAFCPAVLVDEHAHTGFTQIQDCGEHGSVENAAQPEVRRCAVDQHGESSGLAIVAVSPARTVARRPPRRGQWWRPPAAGRDLLHRLCIART